MFDEKKERVTTSEEATDTTVTESEELDKEEAAVSEEQEEAETAASEEQDEAEAVVSEEQDEAEAVVSEEQDEAEAAASEEQDEAETAARPVTGSRNKLEENSYVQNGVSRLVFVLAALLLGVVVTVIAIGILDEKIWIVSFLIRLLAFFLVLGI